MALLNNFRVDSRATEEGEWVSPGEEEYDDLMIKTRGFTDRYQDYRAVKLRRAAVRYNNDVSRIPASVSRDITIEALIAHCLIDVKNIVDDAGKAVSFADFCNLLRNPDFADLVVACLKAVAVVGMTKRDETDDAQKN